MNIDWTVAFGVFLVFVIWAFAFYGQLFVAEEDSLASAMEKISDSLLDNLTVSVHSMPIKVNYSNVSVSNAVLYFEYRWPFGKNTTKIYKGSDSQTCNITGNKVYWQSDMDAFLNYFRMEYSEQKANLSCTGGFSVVNETQVVPFAAEEQEKISLAKINEMNATNYSSFKSILGILRDFNITIKNSSATIMSYGLPPPGVSNVFSKKVMRRLEDRDENITIVFLTW